MPILKNQKSERPFLNIARQGKEVHKKISISCRKRRALAAPHSPHPLGSTYTPPVSAAPLACEVSSVLSGTEVAHIARESLLSLKNEQKYRRHSTNSNPLFFGRVAPDPLQLCPRWIPCPTFWEALHHCAAAFTGLLELLPSLCLPDLSRRRKAALAPSELVFAAYTAHKRAICAKKWTGAVLFWFPCTF